MKSITLLIIAVFLMKSSIPKKPAFVKKIAVNYCNCNAGIPKELEYYDILSNFYNPDKLIEQMDNFIQNNWVDELKGIAYPEKRYNFKIIKLSLKRKQVSVKGFIKDYEEPVEKYDSKVLKDVEKYLDENCSNNEKLK